MFQHGETRRLLVEHALTILSEDGLGAVTIRGVARRAGLSHGAPLRHFPSLAALLSAAAAQGFDNLLTHMREISETARADGAGVQAELTQLAHGYVQFAGAEPALFELMFRHDLLDASGEDLRSHSTSVFTLIAETVARSGIDEYRKLTMDLWVAVHGIAVLSGRRALEVIGDEHAEDLLTRQVAAHLAAFTRTGGARSAAR